MSELLSKFSFHASKLTGQVVLGLLLLWLAVLACVISSIRAQPFSKTQRTFWIAVVVVLPVIGLLAYLPFSFRREDLPQLFAGKQRRQKRGQTRKTPSNRGPGA